MASDTKRIVKICLLSAVTLAFLLMLIVNYMSSSGLEWGRDIGLFPRYNTSKSWTQRTTFENITIRPAGWAFSVWGVIYPYQAILFGFLWSTICRRVAIPDGSFLCCEPDLAPYGLLVCHILSSFFNALWIVLAERSDFERPILIPMTLALFFLTFSLYGALAFSYWRLYQDKASLTKANKTMDFWLTVGLVQNGLSLYAGWCTVASFVNLDMLFVFYADLDEPGSTAGCLCGLLVIVVAYAVCDLTILDMSTRFVFTPHLVVIWAAAAVLSRNYEAGAAGSIVTIVLICLTALALVAKIILIVMRTKSKPILDRRLKSGFQSQTPLNEDL